MAVKLSGGAASGSRRYMASYSAAVTQVMRELADGQLQKYEAMAIEWSGKELPPAMQQR